MENQTIRLDKYLANLGICSRRDVKQVLKKQIVTVNGKRVRESGTRIDPKKDTVLLNGKKIKQPEFVYYMLNKPKGIISTTSDELGRDDVTSFIPTNRKIYPVGRLDKDTTGLILLTNDGELTHALTHPKYHVYKTYQLTIEGRLRQSQLYALREGVLLDDGITQPAAVTILREKENISILEMTIHEGRNRQIRRMCETVGIKLLELQRIKFGPIVINGLKEGEYRQLMEREINKLKNAAAKNK